MQWHNNMRVTATLSTKIECMLPVEGGWRERKRERERERERGEREIETNIYMH